MRRKPALTDDGPQVALEDQPQVEEGAITLVTAIRGSFCPGSPEFPYLPPSSSPEDDGTCRKTLCEGPQIPVFSCYRRDYTRTDRGTDRFWVALFLLELSPD